MTAWGPAVNGRPLRAQAPACNVNPDFRKPGNLFGVRNNTGAEGASGQPDPFVSCFFVREEAEHLEQSTLPV